MLNFNTSQNFIVTKAPCLSTFYAAFQKKQHSFFNPIPEHYPDIIRAVDYHMVYHADPQLFIKLSCLIGTDNPSIVENSRALASSFIKRGVKVATGGTDNHLLLIDVTPFGLNGRMAETLLRECGITLNRNALPFDPNGPWYTSGLRLGSAAVTTLGMGVKEMDEIADTITSVLSSARPVILQKGERAGEKSRNKAKAPKEIMESAKKRVEALLSSFLLYPELDLDWLMENFGEH